ncbi:hypothetical protein EG68_03271, partial [Paragonimus skrjabini miyazakii]
CIRTFSTAFWPYLLLPSFRDVLSYLAAHPIVTATQAPVTQTPVTTIPSAVTSSSAPSAFTDIPISNIRQVIAKRLTQSKSTIPHAYVRSVAKMDKVMQLRKKLNSHTGLKVSINDVIIKSCALGLRLVPELNAVSDATNRVRILQPRVDICMAVATPTGLITPILRDVDQVPITQLSLMATSLAKKAREGKLQPHEFQGGSFTISNLGMFGIREFTAIINPPQVAILAVGSGLPKASLRQSGSSTQLFFSNHMTMTLSIDSRYVDEVVAGRFLSHVSKLLSDFPELLFADDPTAKAAVNGDHLSTPDDFETLMLSRNVANLASQQPVPKA